MTTMAFDDAIVQIARDNGLTALSANWTDSVYPEYAWGSYAHFELNGERMCTSGTGGTAQAAIADALRQVRERRQPVAPLPSMTMEVEA